MLRRSSALLVLGMIAVVASCDNLTGLGTGATSGNPIGIAIMNARIKGNGYTTSPVVNFYSVGQATFSFSTINSDTCVSAVYDTTAVPQTAPPLGAGAYMIAAVSGDTDSLYKATTVDKTYRSLHVSGIPFNPGDTVFFNIAGDIAGFPANSGVSRTAEPFTIARPVIPPVGQSMSVNWTPATDNNAAMYVALLYNAGGGTALNRQIFCDFHDDGQGTVQASLLPALSSSAVPFVLRAQRLRTSLFVGASQAPSYFNVISTFDVPTPISP
jgi:hypothetical protein